MDRAKSPALARTAGWLALIGAFIPASLPLWSALTESGEAVSFVGFLIAMVWTGSPAVGAAFCVAASRTQGGRLFFLGVELLLIVAVVGMIFDSAFVHWSSTGSLIYLTWPVIGWPVLGAVIAIASLFGWRAREGWPDPAVAGE